MKWEVIWKSGIIKKLFLIRWRHFWILRDILLDSIPKLQSVLLDNKIYSQFIEWHEQWTISSTTNTSYHLKMASSIGTKPFVLLFETFSYFPLNVTSQQQTTFHPDAFDLMGKVKQKVQVVVSLKHISQQRRELYSLLKPIFYSTYLRKYILNAPSNIHFAR